MLRNFEEKSFKACGRTFAAPCILDTMRALSLTNSHNRLVFKIFIDTIIRFLEK